MVKFLIGVGTGVLVTFLTLFLLFLFLLRFREQAPVIENNSALVLRLEGAIPEKPPMEFPFFGSEGSSVTVANIWMALKKAAVDPHIKAIVLEPENVHAGWAKLEEIRSGLEAFRKSGKPVYAYLKTPGTREYYLATAADRILLGPQDQFYVKGMRAEAMYFKKTLDKLGVTVQVEHAGKYKDFGDMFTRSDMSPETREVLNSVLDDLYGNFIARVAQSRKKTPEEIRAALDGGPFLAREALKAGLVDGLSFEDEMWSTIANKLGGEPKRVSIKKYVKVPADSVGLDDKRNYIALVVGEGEITRGHESDDGAAEDGITSYGFNKLLRRVANDSMVKGVIVRIDSPGGEVTASDEIWRQMNLLSKRKPTVISMSDTAASGGYYMAMTGDPVVAYPGTFTGSIGVVFGKPNLHGLYEKLGVTKDSLTRGRYAAIDSDYAPLDNDERTKLRAGVDDNYRDFVGKVATARKRKFEDVEPVAQGRVWLGSQAKTEGLVDSLGGLDTAVELVKQKAKIPAGQRVTLIPYPARRNLLEVLMQRKQSSEDVLAVRMRALLPSVPVRAWMAGGYLSLPPFLVEVH